LYVSAPAKKGETAKEAAARLEAFVADTIKPELGNDEATAARQAFALFLGTADIPDPQLARNPYGVAFALGRREQLGIDPAKLRKALESLTQKDLWPGERIIFFRNTGAFLTVKEK